MKLTRAMFKRIEAKIAEALLEASGFTYEPLCVYTTINEEERIAVILPPKDDMRTYNRAQKWIDTTPILPVLKEATSLFWGMGVTPPNPKPAWTYFLRKGYIEFTDRMISASTMS